MHRHMGGALTTRGSFHRMRSHSCSLHSGALSLLIPSESQRVHIRSYCGIRPQKTILIMVLGTYFINSSIYGPSWNTLISHQPIDVVECLVESKVLRSMSLSQNPTEPESAANLKA